MEYTGNLTHGRSSGHETTRRIHHFFLNDQERETLRKRLEPFIHNEHADKKALAAVFKDPSAFPARIRRELEALVDEKHNTMVFVLHNLPEIPKSEIPDHRESLPAWKSWAIKNSYSALITEGIYLSFSVTPNSGGPTAIIRYPGDATRIAGRDMHRDYRPLSCLGVLKTDGALTKFIDFDAVLKEMMESSMLADYKFRYKRQDTTASEMAAVFKNDDIKSVSIEFSASESGVRTDLVKDVIARHSLNVGLDYGDLALWRNDGMILHQALPSLQRAQGAGEIALTTEPQPSRVGVVFTGSTSERYLR